jgi:hypothetical protein
MEAEKWKVITSLIHSFFLFLLIKKWREGTMTETKILLDYDEDSFYVCIMCGANARTREALRIHSRHYHTDPPEIIPLDQASYWVDREREKMRKLEEQGKYNRDWIVEEDPNLHDELVRANIIMDEPTIEGGEIVTPDILAGAMVNALKLRGYNMNYNDALKTAEHILNFFGFEDQILENVLENDDREVLYFLEDLDLLDFKKDSVNVNRSILSLETWNISTVQLKKKKIFELSTQEIEHPREVESLIYEKLPEEAWAK